MWRARSPREFVMVDGALAAAIGALGYLDLRSGSGTTTAPLVVTAAAFLVMAGCVTLRRVRPLECLLLAVAVFTVLNVAYGSPEALGGFLALLFLAYASGAYDSRRRSLIGLAVLVAGMVVHDFFDPTLHTLPDYLIASVFDLAGVGVWFAGAYVRTRRQLLDELRRRADVAAAEERTRIAHELHDVVAHGVTVMVLQAEAAAEVLVSDPAAARRAIGRVQEVGRESLADLRTALGVLRQEGPSALSPQPDAESLHALMDRTECSGLPVDFRWTGGRDLDRSVSLSLYRIAQEALTNVLRHAHASRATVTLDVANEITLEVTDDGRGPSGAPAGTGLLGMKARAELLGGHLDTGRAPSGGFFVRATIPRGVA